MTKCPFCQYDNEDGALFCEQCKSDLGVLEPGLPTAAPPTEMKNLEEATEAVVITAVPVASPVQSENVRAVDSIPVARPVTRDSATLPYAEVPTTPVTESSAETPSMPFLATSSDTVDSIKTFVPESGSHKLAEKETAQEIRRISPISRDTDVL